MQVCVLRLTELARKSIAIAAVGLIVFAMPAPAGSTKRPTFEQEAPGCDGLMFGGDWSGFRTHKDLSILGSSQSSCDGRFVAVWTTPQTGKSTLRSEYSAMGEPPEVDRYKSSMAIRSRRPGKEWGPWFSTNLNFFDDDPFRFSTLSVEKGGKWRGQFQLKVKGELRDRMEFLAHVRVDLLD